RMLFRGCLQSSASNGARVSLRLPGLENNDYQGYWRPKSLGYEKIFLEFSSRTGVLACPLPHALSKVMPEPTTEVSSGPASRIDGYAEVALTAAAIIAALVFIVVGISRPVWLDEANSVRIARQNLSGVVDSLSRDNNLPFYYFLLSAWMRLFG